MPKSRDREEQGYLFVYLSYDNDSPDWVYFDDFKVTHTTTNVIQYNEYYPFGLRTENSWTREDHSNKFLYNAGAELNANSGWYETFFRGYDAALGRFMQVDPLASVSSSHSPYHYAYNNPVLFNDPLGDRPEEVMRDLERYGGGGHSYQMYDYSDSWGQGSGNNQYGQHRIGPGSGNHWSNQYSNAYRDHFLMNGNDFAAKYGRSSQAYQEMLNASNADWGKPTGTSDYVEGSFDTNKYGSWLLMNGSWVDMTSSDQMANRSAWEQQGDNIQMHKAGALDLPLAMFSAYSFGQSVYDAGRHYALVKTTHSMLNEYNRLKNSYGAFASRQTQLLKNVTSNINALEAMEVASKRMFVVGTVIGVVDIMNSKPEERLNKAAWLAADTTMGVIGMTGWGAPIALGYFTGRFVYGLYEAAKSH